MSSTKRSIDKARMDEIAQGILEHGYVAYDFGCPSCLRRSALVKHVPSKNTPAVGDRTDMYGCRYCGLQIKIRFRPSDGRVTGVETK